MAVTGMPPEPRACPVRGAVRAVLGSAAGTGRGPARRVTMAAAPVPWRGWAAGAHPHHGARPAAELRTVRRAGDDLVRGLREIPVPSVALAFLPGRGPPAAPPAGPWAPPAA